MNEWVSTVIITVLIFCGAAVLGYVLSLRSDRSFEAMQKRWSEPDWKITTLTMPSIAEFTKKRAEQMTAAEKAVVETSVSDYEEWQRTGQYEPSSQHIEAVSILLELRSPRLRKPVLRKSGK